MWYCALCRLFSIIFFCLAKNLNVVGTMTFFLFLSFHIGLDFDKTKLDARVFPTRPISWKSCLSEIIHLNRILINLTIPTNWRSMSLSDLLGYLKQYIYFHSEISAKYFLGFVWIKWFDNLIMRSLISWWPASAIVLNVRTGISRNWWICRNKSWMRQEHELKYHLSGYAFCQFQRLHRDMVRH